MEFMTGVGFLLIAGALFRFVFKKLRAPVPGCWAMDVSQNLSVLSILALGVIGLAFMLQSLLAG